MFRLKTPSFAVFVRNQEVESPHIDRPSRTVTHEGLTLLGYNYDLEAYFTVRVPPLGTTKRSLHKVEELIRG